MSVSACLISPFACLSSSPQRLECSRAVLAALVASRCSRSMSFASVVSAHVRPGDVEDQDSTSHDDRETAKAKAIDLMRDLAEVAFVRFVTPSRSSAVPIH